MKPLEVAVIGAGSRGFHAYANFALRRPHLLRCVAVAEPDDARRDRFGDAHGLPANRRYRTWQELVDSRPAADGVINCLQDSLHLESALAVLEAGYHQLLEKPIAATPHDCVRIVGKARETGLTLAVCHVMRYAPFYQAMRRILDTRDLGEIVTVEHKENVAFWHYAHSFVRGPWSRKGESSPMILAKSCHDMDILLYLIGRRPVRLSSFGSLSYFRPENAPAGAADRCLDGCPAEPDCPWSVLRTYLGGDLPSWVKDSDHLSVDKTREGKLEALRTARHGRCVFKAGNDVVDHQVVNIEFEGGATANFLMHAFSRENTRTMRYGLTRGEIKGHHGRNEIRVGYFGDGTEEIVRPGRMVGGHGGGDTALMLQFTESLRTGDPAAVITNADVSLESHLMAFAAEESRLNAGQVIEMAAYRERIEKEAVAG